MCVCGSVCVLGHGVGGALESSRFQESERFPVPIGMTLAKIPNKGEIQPVDGTPSR